MMLQKIPRQERMEKANAILNELGIGEFADRRPSDMSGGTAATSGSRTGNCLRSTHCFSG